jgi:hypothetical protein
VSASYPCVCLMATHGGTAAAMQVWQDRLWAVAQALWAAAHPEGWTLLQSLLTVFQSTHLRASSAVCAACGQ